MQPDDGKLGRSIGHRPRSQTQARRDKPALHGAGIVDHLKGGCGSKINHDDRVSVKLLGGDAIGNAIGAEIRRAVQVQFQT